jgi:O-antigen/teichoic acid export membrane protein
MSKMVKKQLFKDLSANTIQTGFTQVVGLIIFYILSKYISKQEFGEFQWTLAVGSTLIAIGSLGLDLVLVKRIAAGQNPRMIASIHFFHTVLVGLILIGVLLFIQLCFPSILDYHPLFSLIIFQLIFTNIANSFKFSLTGLEAFKALALISVYLNLAKLATVIILLLTAFFTIKNIVFGFILSSLIELTVSYTYISLNFKERISPVFNKSLYKEFIYESLPQLGVVFFDSALARIDWILLGIISTVTITGEYSFAYKFFELSKLPLLILAPVLLTRFSKLYNNDAPIELSKQQSILRFFNLEMFIAFLIPIFMVCVWTDLIDWVTDNKYGAVNEVTYAILALCVPLHFAINFFWTIGFVQGQLKTIMYITIGVAILNLIANVFLIPIYGSIGAAISFLIGTIAQFLWYFFKIKQDRMKVHLKPSFYFLGFALASIFISKFIFTNNYISAISACIIYISFALLSKDKIAENSKYV